VCFHCAVARRANGQRRLAHVASARSTCADRRNYGWQWRDASDARQKVTTSGFLTGPQLEDEEAAAQTGILGSVIGTGMNGMKRSRQRKLCRSPAAVIDSASPYMECPLRRVEDIVEGRWSTPSESRTSRGSPGGPAIALSRGAIAGPSASCIDTSTKLSSSRVGVERCGRSECES
jgi:hypothetical protein